ncbi:UNVERIFIED_CONTAM: Retrovirus-related Pol polyprotein from transposon TNT 1-94 [Sesamum calycinum]|uniref:Retrovirus-related Pol polyprotein from transposon TNT 1-94 n=1 Tax=Sesamum calycinum TaxID=2727403 RepID=A0AAW2IW21_9LAMI
MIKKSGSSVLIGEASTSKAKGKRSRRWKRKKGKAKAKTIFVAKDAKSAPVAPVGMGKGNKRMGTQQQSRANDICAYCREKGHWKRDYPNLSSDQGMFVVEVNMVTNSASWVLDTGCGAHICNDLQVLQRSRKLSKDEVVLMLGDGKVVTTEAIGIISLVVSDRVRLELKDCYFVPSMIKNIISIPLLDNVGFEFLINKNCFYLMKDGSSHLLGKLNNGLYILQMSDWIMTAQNKHKLENLENAQIWHARLGHISQDRIKRLVDSKSLEIDNLDNLPACESCLQGKMTKKPFVGQSKLANGLLDLIHTDVCGPLNTQADDHSRYDYVYLMRYKSEAFVRFKEFRLEVENQTGRKIKTLRLDRGGEYLSGEFIDYLKENDIISQWTPLGMPQLNGVAERRNRTLLDMIRSMMSFTELSLSFWGYALETAARFIGYPKETVGYYFYDPSEQKVFVSRNAVFLERGFPTDTRRDELLLEESSEAPQSNIGTSSAPNVSTDNVPILCRSARVPQPPERYGFLGMTGQLDNDPRTYGEAMLDIDSGKWLEAMKSEMDSISSNQVWTLVDRPRGVRPVGCKWVYKRKIEADGVVTTFKARLIAKGYTQRPEVDFEETFSPVAMAKSIQIMLAIAAWVKLSKKQSPKTDEELKRMLDIPYASAVGNTQYAAQCTRPDIAYALSVYGGGELILEGFSDTSFQSDDDDVKSQSGFVFKLNGGVVAWKSSKQDTTADSTKEAEYIAASEAAKEAIWMKNYI